MSVLPSVGTTVRVSFYSCAAESLAAKHSVIASLLLACPKPRAGTHLVKTARSALKPWSLLTLGHGKTSSKRIMMLASQILRFR